MIRLVAKLLAIITATLITFCGEAGHPCRTEEFQAIEPGATCTDWADGLARWMLMQDITDEQTEYYDWWLSGCP